MAFFTEKNEKNPQKFKNRIKTSTKLKNCKAQSSLYRVKTLGLYYVYMYQNILEWWEKNDKICVKISRKIKKIVKNICCVPLNNETGFHLRMLNKYINKSNVKK